MQLHFENSKSYRLRKILSVIILLLCPLQAWPQTQDFHIQMEPDKAKKDRIHLICRPTLQNMDIIWEMEGDNKGRLAREKGMTNVFILPAHKKDGKINIYASVYQDQNLVKVIKQPIDLSLWRGKIRQYHETIQKNWEDINRYARNPDSPLDQKISKLRAYCRQDQPENYTQKARDLLHALEKKKKALIKIQKRYEHLQHAIPEMASVPGTDFEMGKYEITNAQFSTYCRDMGIKDGVCGIFGPNEGKENNLPVTSLTWFEAKAFSRWLSDLDPVYRYRLPKSTEWAQCLGKNPGSTDYFWGNDPDKACIYANIADISAVDNGVIDPQLSYFPCDDSFPGKAPVGRKRENAFGLFDMTGNVWEWTEDPVQEKPVDFASQKRIVRGGSWLSGLKAAMNASTEGYNQSIAWDTVGFRLVREKKK